MAITTTEQLRADLEAGIQQTRARATTNAPGVGPLFGTPTQTQLESTGQAQAIQTYERRIRSQESFLTEHGKGGGLLMDGAGFTDFRSMGSSSTGGMTWFTVSGLGTANASVGEGYLCFAGVITAAGTLSETNIQGLTVGTWYVSAKITFSTGAWTLEKVAHNTSVKVTFDAVNTDGVQYYPLAIVVVNATPVITSISRLVDQWCIYENRV